MLGKTRGNEDVHGPENIKLEIKSVSFVAYTLIKEGTKL